MDRTLTIKTTTTEHVVFSEEEILSLLKTEMVKKYPHMAHAEGNFMTKEVLAGFGNMTRRVNYIVFITADETQTKE